MGILRTAPWLAALLIAVLTAPALAAEGVDASPAAPEPMVAAGLALGAPLGLAAISMLTPYKELIFFAPLTYGAGHLYAQQPSRALAMSAGGYGAAVAGAGLAVGVVSLWPGTSGESLTRVLWGGALGAVGFGPFVAWDAMRVAKEARQAP